MKLNMEIMEYIDNSDYDEAFKSFFKSAFTYEFNNQGVSHYTDKYKQMINNSLNIEK